MNFAAVFLFGLGTPRRARGYSTNGGSHTCPGAHLARTEVRILIEEWLRRIPEFGLAANATPGFTGGIVGSVEMSERFLWDWREVAQELVVQNHAVRLRELQQRSPDLSRIDRTGRIVGINRHEHPGAWCHQRPHVLQIR